MIDRTFGHFFRVLVDLDLSQELRYKVLVERKGFAFFVDLDYESMHDFCNFYKIVGHHVGTCRRNKPNDSHIKDDLEKKNDLREALKGAEKGKDVWKEKNILLVDTPSSGKNQEYHFSETVGQNANLDIGFAVQEHPKVDAKYTNNIDKDGEKEQSMVNAEDTNSTEEAGDRDSHSKKLHESFNKDFDDASTVAFEFVDAIQWNNRDEANSGHEIVTPARVHKDMQFLQESWANLDEKEGYTNREISYQIKKETKSRIIASQKKDMGKATVDEQGFQIVRRKKKQQMSQSQGDIEFYATRSKDSLSQHTQLSVSFGI